MLPARRMLSLAAVGTAAIAYVLAAHLTLTTPGLEMPGLALAVAPVMLALLNAAWHSRRRIAMLALLALCCAMLLFAVREISHYYMLVYWAEHAGTELLLCLAFGRSLYSGREPIVSMFAKAIHGTITADVARYTRQVTLAWTIFFGAMAAVSTILFVAAPLAVWSIFANFFTAPLICLMFAAEYLVRRRCLPHMQHAHIMDGVKAYWKTAGH